MNDRELPGCTSRCETRRQYADRWVLPVTGHFMSAAMMVTTPLATAPVFMGANPWGALLMIVSGVVCTPVLTWIMVYTTAQNLHHH